MGLRKLEKPKSTRKPVKDKEKTIYCPFDEPLSVSELIQRKNPNNRNSHSAEQIRHYATAMKLNGVRRAITVSTFSGKITKGHGRLEAALFNGWQTFPVIYEQYDSAADELADAVADNSLSFQAEMDMEGIREDLKELGKDFNLDRLGLDLKQVEFVAETAAPKEKELDENIPTEHRCPKCDYVW